MKEQFAPPYEQDPSFGKREMNGIPYENDTAGPFTFEDINIGGEVDGEDFRDFIVNAERVGVRMDSTLVLPKGTILEPGAEEELFFTLPRTKQRGRIYRKEGVLWATPA